MKNYILKNENAVYFEAGFSCDNVMLLCCGSEKFFITDARYTIEAKQEVRKNIHVIQSNDLIKTVRQRIKKNRLKKIIYDPYDFNVAQYNSLIHSSSTKFVPKAHFSKLKRMIKTDKEINLLAIAAQFGRDGFDSLAQFIAKDGLGKTEQYLHFKAKQYMSNEGEFDLSFDPIVAINANAAKPHALPGQVQLGTDDLLLVDAGIKYQRYCSDRTCTSVVNDDFHFEREQSFKRKKHQKIYDIVLKAQHHAIKKAREGMKASQIDALTRDIIDKAGYGKYFVHSTGHGVGLDIHEYPNINSKSDVIIENNMVFTIEPGIYLPDEFGVRIEDTVVMQNGKAVIL
ncbi:MAG: M24 family metallopeptidase [Campylobacterota bacterium]|nr:M24 family metallopeptidase [Campylobacterota bacterium]